MWLMALLPALVWAQQSPPRQIEASADDLFTQLAQPATVLTQIWSEQLPAAGQRLRQMCMHDASAVCAGLNTGLTQVKPVTVTVGQGAQTGLEQIYPLTPGCHLLTVRSTEPSVSGYCAGTVGVRPVQHIFKRTLHHYGRDNVLLWTIELTLNWVKMYKRYGDRFLRDKGYRHLLGTIPTELISCDDPPTNRCEYGLRAQKSACLAGHGNVCTRWITDFSCYPDGQTAWQCPPPDNCANGGCAAATPVSHTGKFATAIAMLEMARQAGTYLETDAVGTGGLRVFRGTYAECRDKIAFGLGDCCRYSKPGTSSNRTALANMGIGMAVRGVEVLGSPHVHDMLFTGADLARSLKGLGAGVSGLASSFTPSLSFYGMEVIVSDGALGFGFDPASFAVAVALAVVANLLACEHEEQLLSLRTSNGLCVKTRDWCSKRTLFFCREEREAYCCYNSKLARVFMGAAKQQLGLPVTACHGLTPAQLEQVDFSQVDLAPVLADFANTGVDTEKLLECYQQNNITLFTTMTSAYDRQ